MFNLILSSMNSERLESSERRFIVLANSNPLWANTFTTTINKAGAWAGRQRKDFLLNACPTWPGNKLNQLKMPSPSQHQALGALLISLSLPGPWTTSPSTRHQTIMIERRMNESCGEYVWRCLTDYFQSILHLTILLMTGKNPCRYYIYSTPLVLVIWAQYKVCDA